MLKGREIALGFLLATALWVVLILLDSGASAQYPICSISEYTGKESCPTHYIPYLIAYYVGYWANAASNVIIAFATIAVAALTRRLWLINKSQLNRSQEIERAYVSGGGWRHLNQTLYRHGLTSPTIPANASIQMQPNGDYIVLEPSGDFELHINNHGKTPAFLHHARVGFCDAAIIPNVPPLGDRFVLTDAIGPNDQSRRLRTVHIEANWPRTAICGRYYWRDIWGREWSSGFIYEIPNGPALPNDSISVESHPAYWEDRCENPAQ